MQIYVLTFFMRGFCLPVFQGSRFVINLPLVDCLALVLHRLVLRLDLLSLLKRIDYLWTFLHAVVIEGNSRSTSLRSWSRMLIEAPGVISIRFHCQEEGRSSEVVQRAIATWQGR